MTLGWRVTLVILGMAVLCILFAASAYGPRKKKARPLSTSTPWTIQSWQKGTITVEHDDRIYDATCNSSASITVPPGYTLASPKYDFPFSPNCDLPIRFVGKPIQNAETLVPTCLYPRRRRYLRTDLKAEADGSVTAMWSEDWFLTLQTTKDGHGTSDQFTITSVHFPGPVARKYNPATGKLETDPDDPIGFLPILPKTGRKP
jgi:hypothetical protein